MSVTGRTAVLGIMADPVAQARTPELVNGLLAARGRDAVLVPLHVGATGLRDAVAGLRAVQNFRGAVVSMPHKAAIVPLLDEVTPQARQVGACNVVRREADGRLCGTNHDGDGFVDGLAGAGHAVAGRRVFLAGAGGAAAAIAFALARRGAAALTIHNRTQAKAADLAERVHAAHPAVTVGTATQGDARGHGLVVNATSLGMRADDALPLDPSTLDAGALVAEVVISPAVTPLLAAAARRGCATHPGAPMLSAQIELLLAFIGV